VDFGPYLQRVIFAIRKNWYREIPEDARMKSGKVVVEFAILKGGDVSGLTVTQSSGDRDLDRAATAGITTSAPFSTLPAPFDGSYLRLRVKFLYNPRQSGSTTQESPVAPEPKQSLSPFSVPLGLNLNKQRLPNDAADPDFAALHEVEILAPKDIKSYDFRMWM